MSDDEIMTELRAARDAYAKRFDYDLEAVFRDLQEKESQRSDRERVAPKAPRIAVGEAEPRESD